jgi:hypothetical protein
MTVPRNDWAPFLNAFMAGGAGIVLVTIWKKLVDRPFVVWLGATVAATAIFIAVCVLIRELA